MKSQHLGTYQGDRHIEDAENDPTIKLGKDSPIKNDSDEGEEISTAA